jgi:hypothetical protein
MSIVSQKDKVIIRDLAKKYLDICYEERNINAIKLWEDHNSLIATRPPVYCSCFFTSGFLAPEIDAVLEKNCTESFQAAETWFKRNIWFAHYIQDDSIFDPWYPMESIRKTARGLWGFDLVRHSDKKSKGYRIDPAIAQLEDLEQLEATPHIVIDRNPPEVQLMREIIGDILPIHVKCSTSYGIWAGTDLSEALGKLVGLQEYMIMLYENPELIHKLMTFMRDAVLANLEQGEAAGDWSTADGCSYTFLHTKGLRKPEANSYGAKLNELWFFTHAQEFEPVGPEQHKEFLLDYQMPIMKKFALVSYGCCETLDGKIDLLRSIPNLRSICAGPKANIFKMAEEIGKDYVISWRPNPSMVSFNFDIEKCRQIVREGFQRTKGCRIELMLKEMITVQNDLSRLAEFTKMAIKEAEAI